MKRSLLLLFGLILVGIVAAQGSTPPDRTFETIGQIGQLRPQGIEYNRALDQYVMIDSVGNLVLIDAATYVVQHTLYPVGTNINSYEFSHSGDLLAVAIDTRIDIWDTRTGQIVADFAPDGALSAQRPLYFSEDDAFLAFETVIRAPQAIRRSENDTSILPWLWDVSAGRRIRGSQLPGRVQALPFFESRGGVVLGPNNTLIAAIVERLWIQGWDQSALTTITELNTGRAETDPLQIWQSVNGDSLYINDDRSGRLYQVDTYRKTLTELPLNFRLSPRNYAELSGELVFSPLSRVIGERLSRENNSLLDLLLGEGYRAGYDYHPLTVTLIDILDPMTVRPDEWRILLHVFDEQTAQGQLLSLDPDAIDLALHPDGDRIAVRRSFGDIEVYRLSTGALERVFTPLVRDLGLAHELDFTADGTILISDFARYDLQTGDLISDVPEYVTQFDAYYFSLDNQSLFTHRGNERWTWNLTTNRVEAREVMDIRGTVIGVSPDNGRYLINDNNRIEIYTVGTGNRQILTFESLPGRSISDVIPSPDWQYFLVVYPVRNRNPGAISLYHLDRGLLWTIEGGDLPESSSLSYGWVDLETIYVLTERELDEFADRIYGITYHGSGLPQCLVDRFPDDYPRWLPIWERLHRSLRGDSLHRLAFSLCSLEAENVSTVDAVFTPTPTQPVFNPTPTRSIVAGVPSCLTNAFPEEAVEYAQEWRRLTEGLNDIQIDQFAALLCENIGGDGGGNRQTFSDFPSTVMTINIHTQFRSRGTYIPQIALNPTRPSAFPVTEEFFRVEGRQLNSAVVSPNGQLIAERAPDGRIQLWRMNLPYNQLIDNLTATVAAQITAQNLIGVRPTQTNPFTPIGTPRPTLTATMSLTPPPSPEATVPSSMTEVALSELYTSANPPPDWSPIGRMIVGQVQDTNFGRYLPTVTATPTRRDQNQDRATTIPTLTPLPGVTLEPTNTPVIPTNTPIRTPTLTPTFSILNMDEIDPIYYDSLFWLDPRDGSLQIDETIPRCDLWRCSFSFDQRWMLYQDDEASFLMRPDGSESRLLQDFSLNVSEDQEFSWDQNLLQYRFRQFDNRTGESIRFINVFDPNVSLETPLAPLPTLAPINMLFEPETVTQQPITGRYAIARVRSFDDLYTYYLVDTTTGEQRFFARTDVQIEVFWSPAGDRVYYRFDRSNFYVFDTETGEHRWFGASFPTGVWSQDGRYRADWYEGLPSAIERERREANLPVPKLQVWDSETGETRLYAVPDTAYRDLSGTLLWSPDARHLAFQAELESERNFETARPHLLVLELATGYVMTLGYDLAMPTVWYAQGGE